MPSFIKGMELSRLFYDTAVVPILEDRFAGLEYSAGRLGSGSDVLGFDNPQSRDYDWGPQVDIFLNSQDYQKHGQEIYDTLANTLPQFFRGYSTHFDDDYLLGTPPAVGPIIHRARIHSYETYFSDYLGFLPTDDVTELQWLHTPTQKLRTIKYGGVFHDGPGVLGSVKRSLAWYPDDIWRYLLACQWRKIDQEEPFMARCGDVDDELGSRVIAARQVYEVMSLCFLMEREYQPYSKWLGTAFSKLNCSPALAPLLE